MLEVNFQTIKDSALRSYNVCDEILSNGMYLEVPEICQGCGRIIEPQEKIEIVSDEYIMCEDCFDSMERQIEEGF